MWTDADTLLALRRVLDMVSVPYLLTDGEGDVVLPAGDAKHLSVPEAARKAPGQPYADHGRTMVWLEGVYECCLFLMGEGREVASCARLAHAMLKDVLSGKAKKADKGELMRMLLKADPSVSADISGDGGITRSLGIKGDAPRCVIALRAVPDSRMAEVETVVGAAGEERKDIVGEMGYGTIAVIHTCDADETWDVTGQYALAIAEEVWTETGVRAEIGVSGVCEAIRSLPDAYREACEAIDTGKIYHPEQNVFLYSRLLPERILKNLTEKDAARYYGEFFRADTARLFSEETMHDIEVLFENDLNLSETARVLYIHRNTLVYRLEKVQKATGLDLRKFDDALTFRLLILLGRAGRHS